jgi:hypothetical protein
MKDQNPSPPPPPPPAGFSNQQALLLLLICFPLGLIGLGFVVMVTQQVQQQRTPAFREPPSDRVDTSPAPAQPETPSIPSQQADTGPKTVVERQRPPETGLTMDQARSIVEQWLSAKQQIFAPPFDTSVADRIVPMVLYGQILPRPAAPLIGLEAMIVTIHTTLCESITLSALPPLLICHQLSSQSLRTLYCIHRAGPHLLEVLIFGHIPSRKRGAHGSSGTIAKNSCFTDAPITLPYLNCRLADPLWMWLAPNSYALAPSQSGYDD